MNQRGVVLSGLIYALLVFFLLLVVSLLTILWYRQNAVNNLGKDANDLYDEAKYNLPPVITITGSSVATVILGDTYTDAGATALDDINGDLTWKITTLSDVNTSVIGDYTVTYTVSDISGNVSSITRAVNVVSSDYSISKGVNKPKLVTGMTPIKWNGTSWVDTSDTDPAWYNYNTTNKIWANARTADGSMWVWIPRYIYKISTNWHVNTVGTIDLQFSKGVNDNWNKTVIGDIDTGTTSEASNNKWTNHPAFDFGTTKVTGIWVAKFEATTVEGNANGYLSDGTCPTVGDNVTTKTIKIVPNVAAWRCLYIGNSFIASRNMETNSAYGWTTASGLQANGTFSTDTNNLDTHLMKNVEWGAVAYFAKSPYGINSVDLYINNNQNYVTGCAGNTSSASAYDGCQNTYETTGGIKASSTGNIYGIYDLKGGSWERTAAYLNNGSTNLTSYGPSIVNADAKYKDVYTKGATDDQANNYPLTISHKGDAVYETSNDINGAFAWYSDFSYMLYTSNAWFRRGGRYNSASSAGTFSFYYASGNVTNYYGFRPVLLVETGL